MIERWLESQAGPIKGALAKLQADFPPEFLLKSLGAALKRFVFESIYEKMDRPATAARLDVSEENAAKIIDAVFAEMRRYY